MAGGVIGAAAAYLFFTDRGRSLRRQVEPTLDDLARELAQLRGTVAKAADVANEGRGLLREVFGRETRHGFGGERQTSPF
jgi:gas vesicle protein